MTPPAWIQPGESISSARRALSKMLRESGIDTADPDARLLLQIALGIDHSGLIRHNDRALDASEIGGIDALAERRMAGEPIARIAGVKEFWGLQLHLGPSTLVPRPETETVVEAALAWSAQRGDKDNQALRIADLGTGSGNLLLALLSELPDAWGIGTDLNADAVAVAAANAARLGLTQRAAFAVCNYGCALDASFDLIVSNPPYIATGEIASLAREVRDQDPLRALDGGEDGLEAYREIAHDVPRLLRRGGAIILELGAGQEKSVENILRAEQLIVERPAMRDLAGISRALLACRL